MHKINGNEERCSQSKPGLSDTELLSIDPGNQLSGTTLDAGAALPQNSLPAKQMLNAIFTLCLFSWE